jgi:hypothetical protein
MSFIRQPPFSRHYLSDRSLTVLELLSFPVSVVLGFLSCRWNVLPYILGPVNDYLYLVTGFLGAEESYNIVAQIYLWPLLESGHSINVQSMLSNFPIISSAPQIQPAHTHSLSIYTSSKLRNLQENSAAEGELVRGAHTDAQVA